MFANSLNYRFRHLRSLSLLLLLLFISTSQVEAARRKDCNNYLKKTKPLSYRLMEDNYSIRYKNEYQILLNLLNTHPSKISALTLEEQQLTTGEFVLKAIKEKLFIIETIKKLRKNLPTDDTLFKSSFAKTASLLQPALREDETLKNMLAPIWHENIQAAKTSEQNKTNIPLLHRIDAYTGKVRGHLMELLVALEHLEVNNTNFTVASFLEENNISMEVAQAICQELEIQCENVLDKEIDFSIRKQNGVYVFSEVKHVTSYTRLMHKRHQKTEQLYFKTKNLINFLNYLGNYQGSPIRYRFYFVRHGVHPQIAKELRSLGAQIATN